VRMIAAQAIGRLRDPSTIDRLIAAARVPDQHVHVLRSLADALGELGPEAARALPALHELARIPRVAWAANAAMKKIESAK
jgi:HEAT repeat protein